MSGVYQVGLPPSTQALPGSAEPVPAGAVPRNSPGISPSWHTERDSPGSVPMPWTKIQAATLSAMSRMVTTGVARVGLSSR